MKRLVVSILLVVFASLVVPGLAQAQFVEPTDAQVELNEKGIDALSRGDSRAAIEAFERSIALGESNVSYLNLGRAYYQAGECEKAFDAYTSALTAPAVEDPPRKVVREYAQKFLLAMVERCPARLLVRCEPPEAELYVDGTGPHACGEALPVEAGRRSVELRHEGRSTSRHVYTRVARVTELALKVDAAEQEEAATDEDGQVEAAQEPDEAETDAEPKEVAVAPRGDGAKTEPASVEEPGGPLVAHEREDLWKFTAFTLGGGATFLGGLFLDGAIVTGVPPTAFDYAATPEDFIPISLYVAGIGLVVTGFLLYY